MEPRAHHFLIGMFTIVTAAAALVFALWLGKTSNERVWAWYEVAFDYTVSGLSEGNPVLYNGVNVGDVVSLRLVRKNPGEVRVLVRVDETIPMHEDTRASLVLANITGSMSIEFSGGSQNSPLLIGSRKNPPIIDAQRSALSGLLDNSQMLMNKADQLLRNANQLFSADNIEQVSAILNNTREASETLVRKSAALDELFANLNQASATASQAAAQIADVSGTADTLLRNEGRSALRSMDRALGNFDAVMQRLDTLTSTNAGALDAGLQGMGELAPALRELRDTLNNLNRFTRRLDENPAGILWGADTIKELPQ
ncbi:MULTISPECIES: MlaD family protein [unclassified Marinobacter]|uniref:MlaD family protein n=1 Tax=unclassified Marinobacter TaxID=83889 RepID=UPI000BF2F660|nr:MULTISPECIES: MlaD family protein [unclassified Marinobacter]PFG08466.1 phospholipid/cholesterol/gamma-HCH transport system substrate-binding protein [Marinobacter sp. LV10MA510-1]PFG54264.1 phospholipid/cholesterol/gamma-HCH transport system substrate-binding protein [Marinobacter sp. LV10R520-4]